MVVLPFQKKTEDLDTKDRLEKLVMVIASKIKEIQDQIPSIKDDQDLSIEVYILNIVSNQLESITKGLNQNLRIQHKTHLMNIIKELYEIWRNVWQNWWNHKGNSK